MSVRQAVADAIDAAGIPGVAGSLWAPDAKVSGLCWAQWSTVESTQYASGAVALDVEWDVLLTLPSGPSASTGTAMDAWLPPVLAALSPLGKLGTCTPVSLVVSEGGTVPAICIKLHV